MSKDVVNPDSDLDLIRRVTSGDTGAYRGLVEKYQDKVFRLCSSMLRESGAEDAAQDVFIKAYQSLGQFKGKSAFSTWLYRIAANHCLNVIVKKKREKTESLDALMERSGEGFPSASGAHSPLNLLEKRHSVHTVLARMSPDERAILVLREAEGLSYGELAEALDISLDLVKVRLFRARKSFLDLSKKLL